MVKQSISTIAPSSADHLPAPSGKRSRTGFGAPHDGKGRTTNVKLSMDNWKRLTHCATENVTTLSSIINALVGSSISRDGRLLIPTQEFGNPQEPYPAPAKAAGRK